MKEQNGRGGWSCRPTGNEWCKLNQMKDTATRRREQIKKFTAAPRAGNQQELRHHSELPRHQRSRIRKIFSRILQPDEVRFLMAVWKARNVRLIDCPALAASLVRLSAETNLLLAEAAE